MLRQQLKSKLTNRFHNQLYRAGLSLGVFAGTFVLAFIAASLLTPVDSSSAADSSSNSLSMAFTSEQNINISVDKTTVGITADSTDFNKLLTDNFNVTVSTNNSTGYVLNMAVDSSATNGATITSGGSTQENVATNALVNTENNKYYLPSITSSITNPTDSTFPTNSWAYSISNPSTTPTNMTYSPLPEAGSSAEIKKVTELTLIEDSSGNLTADDITSVTVATKADMSIPAGAYTNKLIFTAITNFNPEYDSYTITYDANGGTGEMNDQTGYIGENVTLTTNAFSRDGYNFLGWSTDKNATTATYTNSQTVEGGLTTTAKETITLYAIWSLNKHTVTVTVNSGVSGTATGTGEHAYGDTVTLGGLSVNTTGYHLEWSSSDVTLSSTTAANPTFIMPDKDVTITASSAANTYTIAYDNGGGSGTMDPTTDAVYGSTKAISANTFTRTDYYFRGWNRANNQTTVQYGNAQGTSVTINVKDLVDAAGQANNNGATITLYAVWGDFITLKDDKSYTRYSVAYTDWNNAQTFCPSGTHLPSKSQFDTLNSKYSGGGLQNATGWGGFYWSSTEYSDNTSYAWNLFVASYISDMRSDHKSIFHYVVCVKS